MSKGENNMSTTDNKAIARQFYLDAWNEGGKPSLIDTLFSADFLNHEIESQTKESHRELYKQGIIETCQAFPDWTNTIDDMIAEGEKVVMQWHAHGTHTGEGMGTPTGKQFNYNGITIVRIVDGKITEFWKKDNSFAVLHAMQ
jgi:steroid delta-isomerase-like uncharacterized protein